jgi:hypothetical protein
MKKTAILAGVAFFCLIASTSLNAQTPDTTTKQVPQSTVPQTVETPVVPEVQTQTTTTVPTATAPDAMVTTTTVASKDRWNNWDKSKYAMLPMPEPLTTEKIFPALGRYDVTTKDGATAQVTVTLDETNKGIVWIEGLPEGKIMGYLRQSPATYKIPAQKSADEKNIASGVFIYDKDANTLNVCVGCTYKSEDPASAFLPEQPATEETATVTKKTSKKTKAKVVKVKPVYYSGAKVIEAAPATSATETAPSTTTSIQQ